MVTVAILGFSLSGLLGIFVYCSMLSDIAGNMSKALRGAQGKLEEIRDHNYSLITADYASAGNPGNKFDAAQLSKSKGAIYIDSTNPDLLQVKVAVSWKNENGRLSGEDSNLNGVIDGGEDINGNNELDSPVCLISLIARP